MQRRSQDFRKKGEKKLYVKLTKKLGPGSPAPNKVHYETLALE